MTIIPSFGNTYAISFVACIIDSVLYGMAMLYAVRYLRSSSSRRDDWLTRSVVLILTLLSTLHFVFVIAWVYGCFVTHFGDLSAMNVITPEANAQLMSTYLLAFTAQMFYFTQLWRLNHRVWHLMPVALLSLVQLGAGCSQVYKTVVEIHEFSGLAPTVPIFSIQCISCATCDILITILLCWFFHRQHNGIRQTDSVLDRLILYAINRGSVTAAVAVIDAIVFITNQGTFMFQVPLFMSSQLYVISIMSMLTARKSLRNALQETNPSIHVSRLELSDLGSASGTGIGPATTHSAHTGIRVGVESVTWTDKKTFEQDRESEMPKMMVETV